MTKHSIRKLLPRKTEFAVLAVLSLILAAMVWSVGTIDTLLLVITVPLFISCALLGMHRSGRLIPLRQEVVQPKVARRENQ